MIALDELQKVITLAKTGSFNKAAKALNISQPALTKKIARLEDRLKVSLFYRTRRGTTPTTFGLYLIQHGEGLLEQSASLMHDLRLIAGLEMGELRLGVGPAVEHTVLPRALALFFKQYPNITFDIRVDNANILHNMLLRREIDIMVAATDPKKPDPQLIYEYLAGGDVILAARPGHPLIVDIEEGKAWSVEEVFQFPIAAPGVPSFVQDWLDKNMSKNVDHERLYTHCDNYRVLSAIVQNSDHISVGPFITFRDEFADGSLCRIPVKRTIEWQISIVTRPEARFSPLVLAMIEILDRVGKEKTNG